MDRDGAAGEDRRRRSDTTANRGRERTSDNRRRTPHMPKWIDHIVVRVKDLDQALKDYESTLGMKASQGPTDQPHLGLRDANIQLGDDERLIELADAIVDGALPTSLAKTGEGIHPAVREVGERHQIPHCV